jgi:hypothetical protein
MYNTILWLSDNRVYLAQWFAALALFVAFAAALVLATKWLVLAFALVVMLACFQQINNRNITNAAVSLLLAAVLTTISYFMQ